MHDERRILRQEKRSLRTSSYLQFEQRQGERERATTFRLGIVKGEGQLHVEFGAILGVVPLNRQHSYPL